MVMPTLDSTAFDAFAADYDDTFTHSTLGRLLRPRVWQKLAEHFTPGQRILELACGTGEDAVWLAQYGLHVTVTDGSAKMVQQTQAKAQTAGVSNQITALHLSFQEIIGGQPSAVGGHFDGLFSNFGGLNTINDWRALAESICALIKPGGIAILVVMGPICPWEMLWHAGHLQFRAAFRRLGDSAPAQIGETTIPIWYPSARQLRADFAPRFSHLSTESLGLWLPPSYLGHLVDRRPNFFDRLNQFEKRTGCFTGGWGDHYIIIFEKDRE